MYLYLHVRCRYSISKKTALPHILSNMVYKNKDKGRKGHERKSTERKGRFAVALKGDLFCFNYTLGMLWEEMTYMVYHDWQDAVYRCKLCNPRVHSSLHIRLEEHVVIINSQFAVYNLIQIICKFSDYIDVIILFYSRYVSGFCQ